MISHIQGLRLISFCFCKIIRPTFPHLKNHSWRHFQCTSPFSTRCWTGPPDPVTCLHWAISYNPSMSLSTSQFHGLGRVGNLIPTHRSDSVLSLWGYLFVKSSTLCFESILPKKASHTSLLLYTLSCTRINQTVSFLCTNDLSSILSPANFPATHFLPENWLS